MKKLLPVLLAISVLGLGIFTGVVIHVIESKNLEQQLIKQWEDKGAECMEEPYTTVKHGHFTFECTVKEETEEQKAWRTLPSDRFDIERIQDTDYVVQYIKDNPPTYDCELLDKYAKPNIPCWQGYFKWGGLEYRTLLFNSDDYFKSLSI